MKYSIFDNTMADMSYQDIEEAAKDDSIVIFPIAVIEEHGPHLPLATDTYIAYNQAVEIKKCLDEYNINSIVAPPFYWGINHVTSSFPGSFTLQDSTMIQVLKDILNCLQKWGFKKVFTSLSHGDFYHNKILLEAFKATRIDSTIESYLVLSQEEAKRYNINNKYDEYVLLFEDDFTKFEFSKHVDVHAGKYETSLMLSKYPNVVKTQILRRLKPTKITPDDLLIWRQGGDKNKKLTPLGYCGNPSDVDIKLSESVFNNTCKLVADTVYKHLKNKRQPPKKTRKELIKS